MKICATSFLLKNVLLHEKKLDIGNGVEHSVKKIALNVRRDGHQPSICVRRFSAITSKPPKWPSATEFSHLQNKRSRLTSSTNLKHPQSLFRLQKVAQEYSSAENRPHAQVDILMQQRFHRDDCAQCCTRRSIFQDHEVTNQ